MYIPREKHNWLFQNYYWFNKTPTTSWLAWEGSPDIYVDGERGRSETAREKDAKHFQSPDFAIRALFDEEFVVSLEYHRDSGLDKSVLH